MLPRLDLGLLASGFGGLTCRDCVLRLLLGPATRRLELLARRRHVSASAVCLLARGTCLALRRVRASHSVAGAHKLSLGALCTLARSVGLSLEPLVGSG